MVQAHPDGQHVFRLVQCHCTVSLPIEDPEGAEFRKVFGNGVVKGNLAFLNEFRNGHAAEALGLGALHERVVHGDGAFRPRVCIADAAGFLDTVII